MGSFLNFEAKTAGTAQKIGKMLVLTCLRTEFGILQWVSIIKLLKSLHSIEQPFTEGIRQN
jgi:hypothetical protein